MTKSPLKINIPKVKWWPEAKPLLKEAKEKRADALVCTCGLSELMCIDGKETTEK